MKLILFLIVILLPYRVLAKDKKKDDFDFGGRIGVGVNDLETPSVEQGGLNPNFEMRFQAKSPRKKGFKAVVELRASENSREVSINDVFIDYRNKTKDMRIRTGRGKKILGWEYEYPTSTRLSINRSEPYQFLAERALVGRDYFVSLVWINEKDQAKEEEISPDMQTFTDSSWFDPTKLITSQEWKYELALHMNEMKDTALIASAIYSPSSKFRFGGWLLGERASAVMRIQGVWETTLSALFQSQPHRAAIEFFAGSDPYRNEIEMLYGSGRIDTFGAIKVEYGAYLGQWNPYLVGSLIYPDLSTTSNRISQGIFGLRYFFTKSVSLTAEGSILANVSHTNPTTLSYNESLIKALMRYFF